MKKNNAFTIVELIVVLLIVSVMAAYFVPGILQKKDDAKVSKTKTQITESIPDAVDAYLRYQSRIPANRNNINITDTMKSFGAPTEDEYGTVIRYYLHWGGSYQTGSYPGQYLIDVQYRLPARLASTPRYKSLVNFTLDTDKNPMIAGVVQHSNADFDVYYKTE